MTRTITPDTKQHAVVLFEQMQHAVANCLDRAAEQHKDTKEADLIVIAAFITLIEHTCVTLHRMSAQPDVMAELLTGHLDRITSKLHATDPQAQLMDRLMRSLDAIKTVQ